VEFIGKYTSGEFSGKELKIYFKIEDSKNVHANIYNYLNFGVKFDFNGLVSFNGYIESETSRGITMTMFIVIYIESDKMNRLFGLKDQDIKLTATIDKESPVTRRNTNMAFTSKIKHILKIAGRHLGYTEKEAILTYQNLFANENKITVFDMYKATQEELELFYDFIIRISQEQAIVLEGDYVSPDYYSNYLRKRRSKKACAVCNMTMTHLEGIIPLCTKHKKEVDDLKIEYPKSWEKKFRDKYTL
jgi:hypothetical protein